MIFKKPKNVTYVDMCKYVDAKIQQDSLSDEEASICYEYLYLIIYMLASKNKYFHREEYYDEFSILLAGDVFHRLFTHPKLKELDEFGNPKMTKLKSCLNYIKAILYGRKVAFEQTNYSQKYVDIEHVQHTDNPVAFTCVREYIDFSLNTNITIYLESVAKTVKHYVYHNSPYRMQPLLIKNIYISCLLSIINSLEFTPRDMQDIKEKYVTQSAKTKYLYKMYKTNRKECIILYHLKASYKPYITVLVRQLYRVIGKDIKTLCRENISIPEDVLMNISLMEVTGREIYDD